MDFIISQTRYTKAGDSSRAVLTALGASFYGQNMDSYKKWWRENKENIFKNL
jgi:hypothetical protein